MKDYYIYVYLDPRKSGKYIYGDYCFLYEPFYVGKGKGRRLLNLDSGRNKYLKNKINKIKKLGFKHFVIKIKNNLCEEKSFILEIKLIDLIGRKDLNKGPLLNFTDGGEGSSNRIISNKTRKKLSISNKGKHNTELKRWDGIYGEKHPRYGKFHSEETKKKISIKNKGIYHTEEWKINHSNMMKGRLSGELNHKSILTKKDIIQIKKYLYEGNLKQKHIAKLFGVSPMTISDIKTGKTWKNVRL